MADIKGSSTYAEVAAAFGIESEGLYRELGLDMKKVPETTKLKDTAAVAGIEGFKTDTDRFAVAKILGVPYTGESGETNPPINPAAPKTVPEALAAQDAAQDKTPTEASTFTVPADFVLEGTMTRQDVAKALSVPVKQVIQKLGLPPDIPIDKPLRDMKDQYGYTGPTLKERIKQ